MPGLVWVLILGMAAVLVAGFAILAWCIFAYPVTEEHPAEDDETSDFDSFEVANPRQTNVIVTLDGMPVPFVVRASADEGWLECWRLDRFGRPILAMGWPIRDRHTGRVVIAFTSEAARREYEDRDEPCECVGSSGK